LNLETNEHILLQVLQDNKRTRKQKICAQRNDIIARDDVNSSSLQSFTQLNIELLH